MTATTRFVAASIARMQDSIIQQLLTMRRAIAPFNTARGLRTVLLYTGGWFVQWHEGPAEAVERTWEISRSHTTHSHPRVVHRSVGAPSLRECVQIAALVGPDRTNDVARKFLELERGQQQDALEPVDIWRRFGAPPAGRFSASAEGMHRAIAVVSHYTESIELVKALSEHCRVPMNYQRFAGPDLRAGDAGAAYVDLGLCGRRTRVQALSCSVLGYSIARLSFARVDGMVLLHNRRAHSADTLRDAIAPFLAAIQPAPAFHVVGLDGRSHLEAVLDICQRLQSPSTT